MGDIQIVCAPGVAGFAGRGSFTCCTAEGAALTGVVPAPEELKGFETEEVDEEEEEEASGSFGPGFTESAGDAAGADEGDGRVSGGFVCRARDALEAEGVGTGQTRWPS